MEIEKYKEGFKPKKELSESELRAKKYIIYMLIVFGIYLLGFVGFALSLEYEPEYTNEKTDAIIVLTGETRRITESIAELNKGNSPKLFISGVYLKAPLSKVIDKTIIDLKTNRKLKFSPDSLKSRISTGKAENTIENALESAVWVNENNVETVRLITSFYHMPRSKLLFKKYLPKTIVIEHPISFSQSRFTTLTNAHMLGLVFSEYNKYLLTYIWTLTGLETRTALKIQGVL
ncbi:MAG: YdcF family protein [Alphaproteobacteria bacterium]|jgi:uncharacterized SAM-binding protein YcdF (DUF218 family)|nr:YdcF family protein [Alphaproteobacteria bacterium]